MDWTVRYVSEGEYVHVETSGDFTAADHQHMVADILGQPFWRPGMAAFFDHRNLRFDLATFQTMQSAARNHEASDEQIGNGKAAILMNPGLGYGSGRQFQELTRDRVRANLRIFTDEQQALEWLLSPRSQDARLAKSSSEC